MYLSIIVAIFTSTNSDPAVVNIIVTDDKSISAFDEIAVHGRTGFVVFSNECMLAVLKFKRERKNIESK